MSLTLKVRVVPQAKKNALKPEKDRLKVYLTAPALEGKANQALIAFLAQAYNVKKNRICITRGLKSRDKIVQILDERK